MKKKEDKKKDLELLREDLARLKNLFVTGYEKLRGNRLRPGNMLWKTPSR